MEAKWAECLASGSVKAYVIKLPKVELLASPNKVTVPADVFQ